MTNNLKNEKGEKYTQKFYEKLGKASLNTDVISSLVLQDKKYEKMPADFLRASIFYIIKDNLHLLIISFQPVRPSKMVCTLSVPIRKLSQKLFQAPAFLPALHTGTFQHQYSQYNAKSLLPELPA